MKFRTFLLLTCMVVVPAVAMFSHQLPPAVRSLPRRLLGAVVARLAAGEPPEPPAAAEPARESSAATVPPPPAVASVADGDPAATPLDQLGAVGAVAIECRPLPGEAGRIASCRVPVDAEGQLHRVFQARGSDAESAIHALAAEVMAWRRRLAGQPSAVPRLW